MPLTKRLKSPTTNSTIIRFLFNSILCTCSFQISSGARLSFQIANISSENFDAKGIYKLNYDPPIGNPTPYNKTYSGSQLINSTFEFTSLLSGTKYNFYLLSVNNVDAPLNNNSTKSLAPYTLWNTTLATAPNPPKNITFIYLNDSIRISWNPPESGGVTEYKLKLQSYAKEDEGKLDRNFTVSSPHHEIEEYFPGVTYRIKIWSIYDRIESTSFTSRNFTTKPKGPELIIMWYRNETSLFTMWNSPDPPGTFTGFQVSIHPRDGAKNIFVPKDGPGTAQAVFNNLIPGRLYNISIKTVSKNQYSKPVYAQYRTVPKRPKNMTVDFDALTPHSAEISWESPIGEFDRYQVQIKEELGELKSTKIYVPKDSSTTVMFEDLVANRTYRVIAQTMSGLVASWPSTLHFTTKIESQQKSTSEIVNATSVPIWPPDINDPAITANSANTMVIPLLSKNSELSTNSTTTQTPKQLSSSSNSTTN